MCDARTCLSVVCGPSHVMCNHRISLRTSSVIYFPCYLAFVVLIVIVSFIRLYYLMWFFLSLCGMCVSASRSSVSVCWLTPPKGCALYRYIHWRCVLCVRVSMSLPLLLLYHNVCHTHSVVVCLVRWVVVIVIFLCVCVYRYYLYVCSHIYWYKHCISLCIVVYRAVCLDCLGSYCYLRYYVLSCNKSNGSFCVYCTVPYIVYHMTMCMWCIVYAVTN